MITQTIALDTYEGMREAIMNYATDTYSGKTGCACGCGGKYVSAESNAGQKRINRILEADFSKVVFNNFGHGEGCYDLENAAGTRCVRVYVKAVA